MWNPISCFLKLSDILLTFYNCWVADIKFLSQFQNRDLSSPKRICKPSHLMVHRCVICPPSRIQLSWNSETIQDTYFFRLKHFLGLNQSCSLCHAQHEQKKNSFLMCILPTTIFFSFLFYQHRTNKNWIQSIGCIRDLFFIKEGRENICTQIIIYLIGSEFISPKEN